MSQYEALILVAALLIIAILSFFSEKKEPVTFGRPSVTIGGYEVKSNAR